MKKPFFLLYTLLIVLALSPFVFAEEEVYKYHMYGDAPHCEGGVGLTYGLVFDYNDVNVTTIYAEPVDGNAYSYCYIGESGSEGSVYNNMKSTPEVNNSCIITDVDINLTDGGEYVLLMYISGDRCYHNDAGVSYPYLNDSFNITSAWYSDMDHATTVFFDYVEAVVDTGEPAEFEGIIHIGATIDTPEDNSYYGIQNVTDINSLIWVNVTHNATGNYTLALNDTLFSLNSNTSTEYYFLNNSLIENGFHTIEASIWQHNSTNATDTTTFRMDIQNPSITGDYNLTNNLTIILDNQLNGQINFTDDLEIYSVNVTFNNGTNLHYNSNIGQIDYTVNISYTVGNEGLAWLDARVCDAHTNERIKEVDRVDKKTGELTYVIKDNPLLFQDEYIRIYSKDKSGFSLADTQKLTDRYSFIFQKTEPPKNAETFIVKSTKIIDIPKKQKYGGHIVIPNLGPNGYWVDFDNNEATEYKIKKIDDYTAEVTIYGLTSNRIVFNSVGELNCYNKTFYYTYVNPTVEYTEEAIEGTNHNFYLNINEGFISTFEAYLYYNETPYYVGNSSNFTQSITAPNDIDNEEINMSFYWDLILNGVNNTLETSNQTVFKKMIDNCSVYSTTAHIIYFKNSVTEAPTEVNATINIEGDAELTQNYYNVSDISICINPDFGNYTVNLDLQYNVLTDLNYYSVENLILDNASDITNIYVQTGTEITTFTIKEQDTSNVIEGAYVVMTRKINSTWQTVAAKYSDITGRLQFAFEEEVEYRFSISKSGYTDYEFTLNPILFDSYDIYLTKAVSYVADTDYNNILLGYSPKTFYDGEDNTFIFSIEAPLDNLVSYGYVIEHPSGTISNTGTIGGGEILTSVFNINGSTFQDRVLIDFHYQTTTTLKNYSAAYDIIIDDNNTMVGLRNNTYGLGLFERLFLSLFIVLLCVGVAALIGQIIFGVALGLIIYGYLAFTGFIPLWSVLISMTIGAIILATSRD